MLDARLTPMVKPLLRPVVSLLSRCGISADQVTVAGFIIGVCAVPAIVGGLFNIALLCIVINRICDGIDGELARQTGSGSSAGGYLDICLDFLFYAAVPLGFGLANPAEWGVPALLLLCAFIGTGSSFLAFATAAEKYQIERPQFAHKSFYYMQGLTEGSETILFFIAVCLWPQAFIVLAYIFACACFITVFTRIAGGYKTLRRVGKDG